MALRDVSNKRKLLYSHNKKLLDLKIYSLLTILTPVNKNELLQQLIKEFISWIRNTYSWKSNYDFIMDKGNTTLNDITHIFRKTN